MFETDFLINKQISQSLAAHLFDSNEYTKRFVIAMGLKDLGFINEAFVLKLIQLSTLPQLIIDKLIRHLLTDDNQVLNHHLIRAWVKRQFNTISVIRCFERCINSDEYVNFFNALDPDKPDPLMTPLAFAQFLSYVNLATGGTPLLMLAMHFKPLLNKIITDPKHRDIIDAIPAIIWGIPCKASTGEHENTSPIYRLSESDEGHDILCSLIERYPIIINALPSEAWRRPRTAAAGPEENASPLYYLTRLRSGLDFLNKLIDRFPEVIRAIPVSTWNQKMQYLGNRNTKVSLLEWIFLQSDCLGTVEKLFIVNPDLDPKMIRGARYPRFLKPSTSNQRADSLNTAETDLSRTHGI